VCFVLLLFRIIKVCLVQARSQLLFIDIIGAMGLKCIHYCEARGSSFIGRGGREPPPPPAPLVLCLSVCIVCDPNNYYFHHGVQLKLEPGVLLC